MPEIALLEQTVLTGLIQKYVAPPEHVATNMFRRISHPFTSAKWDVIKGSREKAIPTLPNREAKIVGQMGIGQKVATFLYLREKKVFEPTTLRWLREPGQLAKNNAEAAVRRETADLNTRLERFIEWTCWEAQKGTLTINEVDVKATVDYGFSATHKPDASGKWSTAATDIITDVKGWKKLIVKDSGHVATDIYLSSTAMGYVYKNTAILGLLSEKHKYQYLQSGELIGLLGLDWHSFDGGYNSVDADFVETFHAYLPDTHVLVRAKGTRGNFILEGLSADDDAPRNHTGKFSKTWKEKDPSARYVLIEYNFIPVITEVDTVIYANIDP